MLISDLGSFPNHCSSHQIPLSQNLFVKLHFFYEPRIYSRSSKGTNAPLPYYSNSINTAEFWSFGQIPSATQSEYSSPGKSCGCTCCGGSQFAKVAKRSRRVTRKPCPQCSSILPSRQGRGSASRVRDIHACNIYLEMRILTRSLQDRRRQSIVCHGPC